MGQDSEVDSGPAGGEGLAAVRAGEPERGLGTDVRPVAAPGSAVLGRLAPAFIAAVLVLAGLLVWSKACFDDPRHGLLYLMGERLVVEPRDVNVGDGVPDEAREIILRITNLSGTGVSILGVKTTCSCVSMGELPARVEPGKSLRFPVVLKYTGPVGRPLKQSLVFTTDCPTQVHVGVDIRGRTVKGPLAKH